MTRDEFARKVRWPRIIWTFGLINVIAMLPQLWQLIRTRETEGLALGMFILYFVIQIAFCLEGFFTRNKMLMWCLGLSATVSAAVITLVLWIRYF